MHCCYLHPIVPLSLSSVHASYFDPYAPAGLYRSAIIAMQLCKKTISDAGGKIPPNLRFFFSGICCIVPCVVTL